MRYCVMTALMLIATTMPAQVVSVKAKLDSTQIWIGSQTTLNYEIIQKKNSKVQLPVFSDTIVGNLEIVESIKLDTQKVSDDNIQVNMKYIVTSFNDSLIYLPPVPFVAGKDTVWSNSLSLRVIQPFEIDTASNTLADIKQIMKPKFDWKYYAQRVLLILLLLVLAYVLYKFIRKFIVKKPIEKVEKPVAIVPAHIEAIALLDKLKEEKLWQHGRVKEYHTELSNVLRVYIEKMFNINSMEMTSDEILRHVAFLKVDKSGAFNALRQILTLADLVKFAKWNPAPNDNEMSLLNAYLFVNQTKIEEVKSLDAVTKELKKSSNL